MDSAQRTTTIPIHTSQGTFLLRVFDSALSLGIHRSILEGRTYPRIDFLDDVEVIVDVGAGVGAAAAYFALHYPQAKVYSFEPCPESFRLLAQNGAALGNVFPFDFGLFDHDCQAPLYLSKEDPVTNSVGSSYLNSDRSLMIELRDAGKCCRDMRLEIDVLKIDTEGAELPILRSLGSLLHKTKVIYVEYHNEADRLAIDALLRQTHILASANLRHPHRGQLCYVAYASFPSAPALDSLRIRCDSLSLPAQACAASSLLETTAPPGSRSPHQVAVVMPTILRPSLKRAVQSVFEQRLEGTAQLLIGVDQAVGDRKLFDEIRTMKPERWALTICDPGYSTSVRHGGVHAAKDGGGLRTILSYAAHSRHVAYLDDDNWWSPDHLASLLAAIQGHDWAYSQRWFVEPESLSPLCIDDWESVGPGQGIFRDRFGGFVDPNTLLIDKLACEPVLGWWTRPLPNDVKGMSADRNVFHLLRTSFRGVGSGQPTCYYRMDPEDGLHPERLRRIEEKRLRQSAQLSV